MAKGRSTNVFGPSPPPRRTHRDGAGCLIALPFFYSPYFTVSLVALRLFQYRLNSRRVTLSLYHAEYAKLRAALLAMRETAELTQTQLADRLGVGQSYVSKLERGENYLDVLIFVRWCEVCGVQPGTALDEIFPSRH